MKHVFQLILSKPLGCVRMMSKCLHKNAVGHLRKLVPKAETLGIIVLPFTLSIQS